MTKNADANGGPVWGLMFLGLVIYGIPLVVKLTRWAWAHALAIIVVLVLLVAAAIGGRLWWKARHPDVEDVEA